MAEDFNAREDWIERASKKGLNEEDYRQLLEDLPTDPALRKEWLEELQVAMVLVVGKDHKDVTWVKEVLAQVPKKRKADWIVIARSLAALGLLAVGLYFLASPGPSEKPAIPQESGKSAVVVQSGEAEVTEGDSQDAGVSFDGPRVEVLNETQGTLLPVEGRLVDANLALRQELSSRDLLGDLEVLREEEDGRARPVSPLEGLPAAVPRIAGTTFGKDHRQGVKQSRRTPKEDEQATGSIPLDRELLPRAGNFQEFVETRRRNVSAFPMVIGDTSYNRLRDRLIADQLPAPKEVRVEEMVNHFDYGYAPPDDGEPFSVKLEMAVSAWKDSSHLLRLGLKAREVADGSASGTSASTPVGSIGNVTVAVDFNPEVVEAFRLVGFDGTRPKEQGAKDAEQAPGALPSGHEVTVLYEIVPRQGAKVGARACSVQLRYPKSAIDKEGLMTRSLEWDERSEKSTDFQWAEVVASWGRMIQKHPDLENMTVSYLLDLARESMGNDDDGQRGEMVLFIQKWDELRRGIAPKLQPMLQFKKEKGP